VSRIDPDAQVLLAIFLGLSALVASSALLAWVLASTGWLAGSLL
jgi:hypothetical protein